MRYQLHQADCLIAMDAMVDESVDSFVTDPPYHLTRGTKGGFMGKSWDGGDIAFSPGLWKEALRILKPGAHLVAFGGTRTYHRLACAIEDAGFEIRDQLAWVFGSGFPKSHNLGDGRGTALKPAWEPIVLARKPLKGTVAENADRCGCGVLHIDACRCETQRWPANLCHDGSEEVTSLFPQSKGQLADAKIDPTGRKTQNAYGAMNRGHEASRNNANGGSVGFAMRPGARRLDTGSAARFFYCAKASKADREAGCRGIPTTTTTDGRVTSIENPYLRCETQRLNTHPTVKPTKLMQWLCRLVTPPGGLIVDPFMGSGSTGRAALLEGFRFIGIERESEYMAIARARIEEADRV